MQRKIAAIPGLLLLIVLCFTSFRSVPSNTTRVNQNALRTIVIDAGHGGKDFGAKGAYSYEKNITLAVALKLQALGREKLDATLVAPFASITWSRFDGSAALPRRTLSLRPRSGRMAPRLLSQHNKTAMPSRQARETAR